MAPFVKQSGSSGRRTRGVLSPWLCLIGLASAASTCYAGGRLARPEPLRLVTTYLTALNAHRFRSAFSLEATCSTEFSISNGRGAPPARIGLPGRGRYALPKAWSYLRYVRVRRIVRFRTALLNRLHFIGVHVDGWFAFAYPPTSARFPGNNERSSGSHRAILILRRCKGRWGIDPNWLDTGGPFNWG